MKKILTLLCALVASVVTLWAQDQEMMQKVMERYKNMTTLTADVRMTKHNTLVTKDVTSPGKFYYKKPDKMLLQMDGGDAMLMNGDAFTMVSGGKANTVSGRGNGQFEALTAALRAFSSGEQGDIDLSDVADVDVTQRGHLVELTITPIITDPKQKRKMPYSAFILIVDRNAGELRSLRLNERGQNFTLYEFSGFTLNAPVADSVFKL